MPGAVNKSHDAVRHPTRDDQCGWRRVRSPQHRDGPAVTPRRGESHVCPGDLHHALLTMVKVSHGLPYCVLRADYFRVRSASIRSAQGYLFTPLAESAYIPPKRRRAFSFDDVVTPRQQWAGPKTASDNPIARARSLKIPGYPSKSKTRAAQGGGWWCGANSVKNLTFTAMKTQKLPCRLDWHYAQRT